MNHFAFGLSKAKNMFIPPCKTNAQNRKLVNAILNLTYPFCSPPPFGKAITVFWNMQLSLHINAKICDADCYDAAQDPSISGSAIAYQTNCAVLLSKESGNSNRSIIFKIARVWKINSFYGRRRGTNLVV